MISPNLVKFLILWYKYVILGRYNYKKIFNFPTCNLMSKCCKNLRFSNKYQNFKMKTLCICLLAVACCYLSSFILKFCWKNSNSLGFHLLCGSENASFLALIGSNWGSLRSNSPSSWMRRSYGSFPDPASVQMCLWSIRLLVGYYP